MSDMTLIVYTNPGCSPCAMAKRKLTAEGIAFVEVDVQANEDAQTRLRHAGITQVPVLAYDGHLGTIADLPGIIAKIKAKEAAA